MTDRISSNPNDLQPEFGELDEIVMTDCTAHLEQMNHDHFCLILSKPGRHVIVDIFKRGRHVHGRAREDDANAVAAWNTRASHWRGMDSAPRDGSWVLIATKPHSRGTVVARWTQAHGKYTWCDEEGETYENAAHWTPLPEPPKEGE